MKLALAAATTAAVLPVAFRKARRVVFLFSLILIEVVILLSLLEAAPLDPASSASSPRDFAPRGPTLSGPDRDAICRLAVASPGWLHCDAGSWHQLKVHANRSNSKFLIVCSRL